jgi:hypothetical protein
VHCEDVVSGATVVTLDSELPGFVLHSEIGSDGSRTVTNEVVSSGESFLFKYDAKEVVESFLMKRR